MKVVYETILAGAFLSPNWWIDSFLVSWLQLHLGWSFGTTIISVPGTAMQASAYAGSAGACMNTKLNNTILLFLIKLSDGNGFSILISLILNLPLDYNPLNPLYHDDDVKSFHVYVSLKIRPSETQITIRHRFASTHTEVWETVDAAF